MYPIIRFLLLILVSTVVISCGGGDSTNSASSVDTSPPEPPPPPPPPGIPTGVAATANGTSSIDLSWSAVSAATLYEIYRNTSNTSSGSTLIDEPLASSGTSYQDTGLTANTTYYYWLKACDANSCSEYSSLASVATQSNPPASPTGLAVTANGSSVIDLSWGAVSAATFYEIYRNTSNTSSGSTLIDEPLVSAGTSYQDTGLAANTSYYYWLKACDTNGCSDYSSFANVITPPASPTGLAATVNGIGAVNLSWSAVSEASFYEIYRNTSDTSSTSTLIGEPLASAGTSYQDTGLTASTSYYYWLKACDTNGCSGYSSFASVITPPASPTNFTAIVNSSSVIDLSWSAVSEASFYEIYRNTSDTSSTSTLIGEPLASAGTSYQDTGLTASTSYYYWLKACDTNGCSDYSSFASATTQIDIQGTGNLNDTGIYWGGDYPKGNNSSCTSDISSPQDCHQGRDAQAATSTLSKVGAGAVGFDFTKLGANGAVLAIQDANYADNGSESDGTKWSCVRDNHTGLVWEVKSNDSNSIHYKNTEYRWGGLTAIGRDYINKEGTYYDDWNDLVSGTNSESLCGFSDWRVPNIEELRSIDDYGRHIEPSIDTHYFPNTDVGSFWSASPSASDSDYAWRLNFGYGNDKLDVRDYSYRLRLLRSGQ